MTLAEVFAKRHGTANAVVALNPQPVTQTYHQLHHAVQSLQAYFLGAKLQPGDTVASIFPNSLECVLAFLGTTFHRCVAAPLNPQLTTNEFSFYLEDAQARLLLVPIETPAQHPAVRATQRLSRCSVWEVGWEAAEGRLRVRPHKGSTGQSILPVNQPRGTEEWPKPQSSDTALLLHTSGTTGKPKAVPLSHCNLIRSMHNIVATYSLSPSDRTYLVMPLFHVHGLVAGLLSTLKSGGSVVIPQKFSASRFWSDVLRYQCTWYTAVPTIHQILLRHPPPPRPHQLRFIRSCSSALAPAVHKQLEQTYKVPVVEAYAMTEAAHQMTSNPLPPRDRKAETVGFGQGVEVAILTEAGESVPTGKNGEICVRGPNVTKGYLNNPSANASSFHQGGWFRTGDQGHFDQDGYLTIIGRIKELINRGGEKISPVEIDHVLLKHPQVADAVSFAVPDSIYGQVVHAAVIPKQTAGNLTEQDIQKFCLDSLAVFKIPKKVYIVKDFPRTATGKVQRRIVAQHFLQHSSTPSKL
ncbi:hypothetical protein IWQ61_008079 [Dispira simplex]|nr:hypothetical protein IWQ61_008079 [Dispira simplex]